MNISFTFFFLIFLLFSTHSYAYLDPGSGSFILQILAVLIAAISGVYLYFKNLIKNLINKIKILFLKISKKDKLKD